MFSNATVRVVVLSCLLLGCEKHASPVVPAPHQEEANRLLNTVVTPANRDRLAAEVDKCLGLSGDQQTLFKTALLREQAPPALINAAFGVPQPEPGERTVSKMIDEERVWEAAGKAEQLRREGLQQKLREVLDIQATSMSEGESSGGYPIVYVTYVVENKSNREIVSLDGELEFLDQSGHDADFFSVNGTKGVKPGEKRTLKERRYDSSLRGMKLRDLTVKWLPRSIVFADGHTMDKVEGEK